MKEKEEVEENKHNYFISDLGWCNNSGEAGAGGAGGGGGSNVSESCYSFSSCQNWGHHRKKFRNEYQRRE